MRRICVNIFFLCISLFLSAQSAERVTIKVSEKQLEQCPVGPYEATWESVRENYRTPEWFMDAKFGIFIHWGVYSVPASGSEWYPRHMYNAMSHDHRQRWGSQHEFGYKDFIPLFKAEKFNAEEWAALFREAGARYVIPTAEHHDGFAMYDSRLTKWNAKRMGPRRDIIGLLAKAVRAEGLRFGVSNHRIENWDFMYPLKLSQDSTDLFLPEYAGLYGPPQKPTEQSGMGPKAQAAAAAGATEAVIDETAVEGRHPQSDAFLNEWEMRVREIIDRYRPDLLYFDNGINYRSLDPWKLRIARYYYNSATHWGKDVSIQSKSTAYLSGSIQDFERMSRAPKQTLDHYWQVDDPIGNKFGYVEGLRLQSADGVIRSLVNNISKNGNLCLNISPKSDGTIPEDQQRVLRAVGRWLKTYGEGVYGTRAYRVSSERNVRFTCHGDSIVYAFVTRWDGKPFQIRCLNHMGIDSVSCLADGRPVAFRHTNDGLLIDATMKDVTDPAVCFRIKLKHCCMANDSIVDLRTLGMENPLGIESTPAFSWKIESSRRGYRQSAYEITVTDNRGMTLWRSGKVASGRQTDVPYEGMPLRSRTAYTWAVTAYDQNDMPSATAVGSFETGILTQDEWKDAKWIAPKKSLYSALDKDAPDNNVPYMGRNFTVEKGKTVSRARLYASAVGVFTMRLNGQPVTLNVLEPGETQYDKHVLYNTYDVTPLIVSGKNTILAQVAGGIANMSRMNDRFVKSELASNKTTTSLRAMLYITYSDGTTQCVNTDTLWGAHKSPTTGSNWYGGEDYDARLEIKDLFTTGYDLGAWEKCEAVSPTFTAPSVSREKYDIGLMRAKEYEPLRIVETWPAVSVTKNDKGNYLVDFGQNFAGTYSFCLKAKPGTTITLYDSELQADNACKFEYMYEARGTSNKTLDRYTFRGDKKGETWGPEFMYHGFRYLEISGLDEAPSPSSFTAKRIRSNMASVSDFTTSNTLLNDIHRICYNGIQSQLYNTVTDCPHREKLGWLDVPNMMYQSLCYNFDIKSLFSKVIMDAFDAQGANGYVPSTVPHFMRAYDDDLNWGGASITIPWRNYKQYGDVTLIKRYYGEMKRLIAYYSTLTQDNIVRNDYSVLSDWGQETSGLEHHTSSSFTLTCAYYNLLRAMTEIATALGHTEDAEAWKKTAADVKTAFNRKFFKDGVYEYGNQANYAMALYYGMVDENDVPRVAKALAEAVEASQYSIKTGEIGLRPTLMSLANNGYNDIVYKMVNKTTYPSYGFWIAQGATTSLEYWDMSLSQNHCMMDHVEEWFFSCLGGISNTGEAYETVRIHPWIPADMASADISVVTPRGKVRMAWKRTAETTVYEVTVPAGSVADVVLPVVEGKKLYEDGKEISCVGAIENLMYNDSSAHFTLGSGRYSFTMDGSTLTSEAATIR